MLADAPCLRKARERNWRHRDFTNLPADPPMNHWGIETSPASRSRRPRNPHPARPRPWRGLLGRWSAASRPLYTRGPSGAAMRVANAATSRVQNRAIGAQARTTGTVAAPLVFGDLAPQHRAKLPQAPPHAQPGPAASSPEPDRPTPDDHYQPAGRRHDHQATPEPQRGVALGVTTYLLALPRPSPLRGRSRRPTRPCGRLAAAPGSR
jgi:hypothetical protein